MDKRKEYSLAEILSLIVKKIGIVFLCMAIGAGGTFFLSKFAIQEEYTAFMAMYVAPNQGIEEGRTSINDLYYAQQVANTYVEILGTNAFMTEVAKRSGLPITANEMRDAVSMQVVENTEIFQVRVVSDNPRNALIIAETIAVLAPEKIMSVVDVNTVKVVDPPVLPSRPTSPNLMVNTVIGFILGVIFSIMLILMRDMLDGRINNEKDILGNYAIPVLGTVPNEKFPVLEAFRVVRANLIFTIPKTGCKRILVTSAGSEEGKTTVICGLAKALGLAGHSVVIIDCDLRNAAVHKFFKLKGTTGLSEVLGGRLKIPDAVMETSIPSLKVIASGVAPPNPAELLAGKAMKELLDTLDGEYEYILMDSPPVNLVADVLGLASITDGVVLIVRGGKTTHPEFAEALSRLKFAKATLLGAVLNDVEGGKKRNRHGDLKKIARGPII